MRLLPRHHTAAPAGRVEAALPSAEHGDDPPAMLSGGMSELAATPAPHPSAPADDAALQDKRTVAITANPYSGARRNRRYVDAMAWALREQQLDPQVIWDPIHRAEQLNDPALFDHCRCVIAAGGDGSLADVINDLARGEHLAGMPLAVLPMGNENLFARQFGFTRRVEATASAIARGRTLPCDLGRCNAAFAAHRDAALDAGRGGHCPLRRLVP